MEKTERGLPKDRDCPNLCGAPNYLRNAKSYELQLWPEHSQAHSKQKAIKILETRGRGRSQGLSKIFIAVIYRAHRAVVFAIAQLSCYILFC